MHSVAIFIFQNPRSLIQTQTPPDAAGWLIHGNEKRSHQYGTAKTGGSAPNAACASLFHALSENGLKMTNHPQSDTPFFSPISLCPHTHASSAKPSVLWGGIWRYEHHQNHQITINLPFLFEGGLFQNHHSMNDF